MALKAAAFMLMASVLLLATMSYVAAAERPLSEKETDQKTGRQGFLGRVVSFFWQGGKSSYEPVWPEAAKLRESESNPEDGLKEEEYKPLPSGPAAAIHQDKVPLLQNIHWKELGLLLYVWVAFLVVQIVKKYTRDCSIQYWVLNSLQHKLQPPAPAASYFVLVATIAAFVGQHVVRRIIAILGRASIIIFILALTIFVSAISLGGVGISNMVEKMANQEYMGFESLCPRS
ncbi:hypothetical protein SAY87_029070 [Trapa incisa]|uniref:Uncharacterized protein n=1 Tax=Trapa incisa TaxID=236973 RepID=A0AAN7L3J2_9MYRT|nr:hypothetical protein SAY87_029070 [Trapa incisa]